MPEPNEPRNEASVLATRAPAEESEAARELLEREIAIELMALRDERLLSMLGEEARERLESPAGRALLLKAPTPEEAARVGSATNGFFCKGAPGISHGLTCKWIGIPPPPE